MKNRGRITPFVGTGATIAALPDSPVARWDGLLEHGIRRCAELGKSEEWAVSTTARLRTGDLITYLAVADEVSRRLDKFKQWDDWIKDTVGSLEASDDLEIHKAICSLNRIVLTTNYDLLLEKASSEHVSLDWQQYSPVREAVNADSHAIIHLHGVATSPSSVVLGSWQYQALKDDRTARFWQDNLLSRRLLFIGCGSGLDDPNIGSALEYLQLLLNPPGQTDTAQDRSSEPHESYILVRGCELGAAWEKFSGSNIVPIAFGPEFSDLKKFLIDLSASRKPTASQDVHEYDGSRTTPAGRSSREASAAQPGLAWEAVGPITKPGLLDLAGPAEETLQEALDVAQRALQALGQVQRRSGFPRGDSRWSTGDQLFLHQRMAASVIDPIRRLQANTEALILAVHDADAPMGLLTSQQDQALDPLFTLVKELASACDELSTGVTKLLLRIKDYLKLTDLYRPAVTALEEVQRQTNDIRETVVTLPSE